jgi:predicted homoserine dehydrogenase-like protein
MTEAGVGVVGTGFIARHLSLEIGRRPGFGVSAILTRRNPAEVEGFQRRRLTRSIEDCLSRSDVLVECSGDPVWATDVIDAAVAAGVPVVTMNTEFHITAGSAFVGRGLVTEAAGDQPGCLASLHEEAIDMGFEPIVYGNMKGFLNADPTREEMEFWGAKQGISLPMVTSFTDGTKVQAEQILVANHFGATIARPGMVGSSVGSLEEGVDVLIHAASQARRPIADFIVSRGLPHGVFIVATHDDAQREALAYYKLGEGPHYTLIRNNIFVHLEILKTVSRVLDGGGVLLDNGPRPELSLAAVAKRTLQPGERIESGIGSFAVRGHAIQMVDQPDHLPIGLIRNARVEERVERGELLTTGHVSCPPSSAVTAWKKVAAGRSASPD